jgi:hypothetical protein
MFAKRAPGSVKTVRLAAADVVGFSSVGALAPYANLLCHRPPLSFQKKMKVFKVRFYYQNASKPFPHDKRVDHFSIFEEYITEKAAIAILFFLVKFEANSSLIYQVVIETLGFYSHELIRFTVVPELRSINPDIPNFLPRLQKDRIPINHMFHSLIGRMGRCQAKESDEHQHYKILSFHTL